MRLGRDSVWGAVTGALWLPTVRCSLIAVPLLGTLATYCMHVASSSMPMGIDFVNTFSCVCLRVLGAGFRVLCDPCGFVANTTMYHI
jgi:hypothetical protein